MSFGSMNNSDNDSNSNSNDSSGNMKRAFMVEEDRAAVNALTALMARVSAATISGHTPPVTTTFSLPTAAKADQEDKDETKETLEIPQRFTKSGRKRAVSFPLKLLKVLSDRNLAHIVTWTPSGKSFTILKPKLFVAEVLPEHFKSVKFSSFTRKLHRWGFLRHYRGEEAGCYHHEEFQRGRLDLVENMTCHNVSRSTTTTAFESALSVEAEAPKTGIEKEASSSRGEVPLAALSAATPMERMATPLMPAPMISFQRQLEMCRQRLRLPATITAATNNSGSVSASVATASEMPSQNTLMAAEINAAIELEVSRRLQERIQLAAAQIAVRSATRPSAASRNAAVPGAGATSSAGISTGMGSLNDSAASAALRVKLLQLQQQKEQMQFMAMTGGYGLAAMPSRGLPPAQEKNVQGAKTA